jgi:uncharacterized protein
MEKLTIDQVKNNELLIFEVVSGSRAYGLETEKSDTDIRGVYVLPKEMFYGLEYTGQVNNDTNDIVYYELKRFVELLAKSNPNILEMLNVPEHCILHRDSIMDMLQPEMFVSKMCEKTFANYAFTQVKKASGLEKKIVNPVEAERKTVLDFCFVYEGKQAVALNSYLAEKGILQENAGLSVITHMKDCYNLYYSDTAIYKGIVRKEQANEVCVSSIPKGEQAVAMLYFNKDGYSVYCKKYKEYWEWVKKRNEERYSTTVTHGKNYDAKNMMHVFRLLLMAKEIAVEGTINVFRKDRDFLLSIKEGKFGYEELVQKADALKNQLPLLFARAALADEPDTGKINELLISMRMKYYDGNE